jgi:gas vesicle protein GvpL/GvpF
MPLNNVKSDRTQTARRDTPHPGEVENSPSSLLYLYCIIDPADELIEALTGRSIPGLEASEPLFAVRAAGLTAAVSLVSGETFQEEGLNALMLDLPRLAPYVLRHDQAIRALQRPGAALLPMTFGTVYRSEAGVATMLETRSAELRRRLDALRGRAEWEIKLYRRPQQLLASVSASSERLRAVADDAASSAPGRAYLMSRLHDRELANEAELATAGAVAEIRRRLVAMDTQVRVEAIEVQELSPSDQQLLYKIAALVPTDQIESFQHAFAELEQLYQARGLPIELSGPWAPYSFVTDDDAAD